MKIFWNQEQMELLDNLKLEFDVSGDLSDEQYFQLDEAVSNYLMQFGLKEENLLTKDGFLCETILDILAEY